MAVSVATLLEKINLKSLGVEKLESPKKVAFCIKTNMARSNADDFFIINDLFSSNMF